MVVAVSVVIVIVVAVVVVSWELLDIYIHYNTAMYQNVDDGRG